MKKVEKNDQKVPYFSKISACGGHFQHFDTLGLISI